MQHLKENLITFPTSVAFETHGYDFIVFQASLRASIHNLIYTVQYLILMEYLF